jgi:hypothetical protein
MFGYVLLELYHFPSRLMILYSRDNDINLLKPICCVHQEAKKQRIDILPTLCYCVLYLNQNKQRLLPHVT